MRVAVYAGSFDPFTLGHLDIVKRATAQFDKVIVCVMFNFKKKGTFAPEERVEMIRRSLAEETGVDNVEVDFDSGLLVAYARKRGASVIVKGVRTIADLESEVQMADINRKLAPEVDTMFFPAKPELSCVSSTVVRELATYQRNLDGYLPKAIQRTVWERMNPFEK